MNVHLDTNFLIVALSRAGRPRTRLLELADSADIAIGVIAAASSAKLLTLNARDFAGIPQLELESVSG